MVFYKVFALLMAAAVHASETANSTAANNTCVPNYNILSLDAAKYKGYMTATMVSYMEQYAYVYAHRKGYIQER